MLISKSLRSFVVIAEVTLTCPVALLTEYDNRNMVDQGLAAVHAAILNDDVAQVRAPHGGLG